MATITIQTTAQQDQRLAPAFGDLLGLRNAQGRPRNATAAEAKAYLIAHIRQIVVAYEERLAKEAIAPPADFSPS